MPAQALKLLAYGRVSDVRGRGGDSFISPDDQMRRCRDYARAYDHTLVEEGLDLDVSGGVMSRPVLDRFLEDIKSRRADGLIVAKLDRFARSSRGALNALAEIEAAGGVLISVQEQIDSTTAAGRFVRSIFLATAEWERERIGEAWLSAKANAVERGIHISSRVPPGYRRRKDRRLEPDPKHAATLRTAYDMATQGEAYARIAEFLTRSRFPSDGKATTWTPNRIARLLGNRVYLGEARYGSIVNREAHEPLVTHDVWSRAQRASSRPALSTNSSYLLTGLVRCAECLYAMRPQKARGKSTGVYRCQTLTASGRCPHPSTIAMARLDEWVLEQFISGVEDMEFVGIRNGQGDGDHSQLIEAAQAAEASYRAALTNLELRTQIGDQDHDALIGTLHTDWQRKLAAVGSAHSDLPFSVPEGISLGTLVERLRDEGRTDDLRSLLASGFEAVLVSPARSRSRTAPIADRVELIWRGGIQLDLPRRGRRFHGAPGSARIERAEDSAGTTPNISA